MLEIRLKNGLFESADGEDFCITHTQNQRNPIVTTTHVRFLDWDCKIDSDGLISCRASQGYNDGVHSIRYLIFPNGVAQTTIWIPHKISRVIRTEQITPDGTRLTDGTIFLSCGHINARYGYYQDERFNEFFNYYGIHTIIYGDPNGVWKLSDLKKDDLAFHDEIFSDGRIEADPARQVNSEEGKSLGWERNYTVKGAKWTAIESMRQESENYKTRCVRFFTQERDFSGLKIPHFN